MSSTLNSKNRDSDSSEKPHSCHLFEKFLVRYPGSQKDSINLILAEKLDRNSLYSKFLDKLNIYENFAINPLSIDFNEMEAQSNDYETSFVIATESECNPFKKISPDAVVVSSKSHNSYKNIAYQRHLSLSQQNNSVSLSEFRTMPLTADAIIRSASCLIFDIDAVRVQDSFSQRSSITGLDVYEACNLARNAGMSENLQLFCLIIDDKGLHEHTEELISLLFWYFLEGMMHRHIDDDTDNLVTYLVQSNIYESPVKFQKSKITDRWSVIDPISGTKNPCTELDYNMMKNGEIPDVLLSIAEAG